MEGYTYFLPMMKLYHIGREAFGRCLAVLVQTFQEVMTSVPSHSYSHYLMEDLGLRQETIFLH